MSKPTVYCEVCGLEKENHHYLCPGQFVVAEYTDLQPWFQQNQMKDVLAIALRYLDEYSELWEALAKW